MGMIALPFKITHQLGDLGSGTLGGRELHAGWLAAVAVCSAARHAGQRRACTTALHQRKPLGPCKHKWGQS
jgi:hypothetical protein